MRCPSSSYIRVLRVASARALVAVLLVCGFAPRTHGINIRDFIAAGQVLHSGPMLLSQEPGVCALTPCPQPPLGGEPVNVEERGTSLFLDFSAMQAVTPCFLLVFRPGDWKLRFEAPNAPNAPFPIELTEFREAHLEFGTGVLGDQPGEGVALFFPWPADAWQSAQQTSLHMVIFNLTQGTGRERAYFADFLGRGGLPPLRLCPLEDGDSRLDVIVQRAPTGFSPDPFDGATDEIVVRGRTATFYVAVVSQLPASGPGVQGWNLFASLSENLRFVGATTAGTVVADVDVQYVYPTPPAIIHPDTGLPQGEGFVATAIPAVNDPPWTLPPVGTATVLRVTVETRDAIPAGGEVSGEVVWRDNLVGVDPESGERTIPVRNNFGVYSWTYYPCTCARVRLVFRSEEFSELLVPPGGRVTIPDVFTPELAGICELIDCPAPRFGEEDPNAPEEPGYSFFIPFSGQQLLHEVGTYFFRPGDWALELSHPPDELPGFPAMLTEFREDEIELGNNGVIGDQPGEGIVIFFSLPPELADAARQHPFHLALTNNTGGTPRARTYLIRDFGFGSLPAFRLCASSRGDSRLDAIVQRDFVGSSAALFAGAVDEVAYSVRPGETGRGTFFVGIVSDFAEPDVGALGWSLSASVTGGLRVVDGRTVARFEEIRRTEGFEVFQIVDPAIIHPDTGLPQGQGFVQAIVLSFDRQLTLPPRGTETVAEVTVETTTPVGEGALIGGEVEWRDDMRGRGQPVTNTVTVEGRSFHFCTCRRARLFFAAFPDCNRNGLDDREEVSGDLAPDCNQNGAPDSCDIAAGTSPDDDGDGVPDECECALHCEPVSAHYDVPRADVHEAVLGRVRITEAVNASGQAVPFVVGDCDQDGDMDLVIRSSSVDAVEPATVHLDSACTDGTFPRLVALRLLTQNARITGYDGMGRAVDEAAASPPYREQVLALSSATGIARVEIRAEQSCLVEVCWCCDLTIPPRFRRADGNGDGKVDISDAVSMLGFLFLGGPAPLCPDAADANDDGEVDISDAVSTLNFLFLGGQVPPEPGPFACGDDPTPSQLGACAATMCP
jgi:hypothetical protein